jgi:hypothetical protein
MASATASPLAVEVKNLFLMAWISLLFFLVTGNIDLALATIDSSWDAGAGDDSDAADNDNEADDDSPESVTPSDRWIRKLVTLQEGATLKVNSETKAALWVSRERPIPTAAAILMVGADFDSGRDYRNRIFPKSIFRAPFLKVASVLLATARDQAKQENETGNAATYRYTMLVYNDNAVFKSSLHHGVD